MPSDRKQINVRLPDDDADRLARLVVRMSRVVGHPCSQADVIGGALAWMEYRIEEVEAVVYGPPPEPVKKRRRKK